MGHHINALIGRRGSLASLIDRLGAPPPTDLDFELVIVPLDEARLDALVMSTEDPYEGFTYLTPQLAEELGRALDDGPVLYIETEYFGGIGGQRAALFERGTLAWRDSMSTERSTKKPTWLGRVFGARPTPPSKSPISRGLEMVGVTSLPGGDEFARLGLVRFRSLEDLGIGYDDEPA